jgi:hypothetical protein
MLSVDMGEAPATAARDSAPHLLGAALLALLWGALWALSHSYRGIFHDASLYTLQALGRLSPASLSQDVFLRFGSQDRFTLFSPVYAGAIRLLGPEWAAALLTLASQCALLTAAWFLARAAMTPRLALLGLSVLIAIPGDYGTDRIFACVEQFLTPRMAAEALALGSLAAALRGRPVAALVLILLAAVIHPLVAAAGLGALLCLYVILPRPRLGMAIVGAAVLLTVCWALLAPHFGRFDPAWLHLVQDRSPYLFLSSWGLDDWGRVAVTLATLLVGARRVRSEPARLLCWAAMLTTVAGLVSSFIGCDELHLVFFTQLQPWRWQWLGIASAALLLPLILESCLNSDGDGRTTALLLAAAWIFGANAFSLTATAAVIAALELGPRLKANETRWLFCGAVGMLAIAVIWRVASNLEFTDAHYIDLHIPLWQRRVMSFVHDGSAPLAVIALTWWLMRSARGWVALLAMALFAAAACAALLPQTWAQWTQREFPAARVADFAPWRAQIPPGTDVFWPDSPLAAWLLLDRPNYLSSVQTSGMVFSRRSALELERRALVLQSVVPPAAFLGWAEAAPGIGLSVQQLQGVCRLAVVEYLVTGADLGLTPLAIMPGPPGKASNQLRLYRCARHPALGSS